MLLVKPSAEILYINTDALNLIERAGRVCYKSEDKITEDSKLKFAQMILKRGHESVIEHASATVKFICDRVEDVRPDRTSRWLCHRQPTEEIRWKTRHSDL
jgi:hypothetical protein